MFLLLMDSSVIPEIFPFENDDDSLNVKKH